MDLLISAAIIALFYVIVHKFEKMKAKDIKKQKNIIRDLDEFEKKIS